MVTKKVSGKSYKTMSISALESKRAKALKKGTPYALKRARKMEEVIMKKKSGKTMHKKAK